MYTIGCDVSKATLDVAWLDEKAGRWVEQSGIPNTRRGFGRLLCWMLKHGQCAAHELRLVLEATCVYHLPLADYAHAAGVRVLVTNPGRAAEHARSQNQLNKNDRIDARGLQLYGCQLNKCHYYVPHSPEIQALRALLARLRQLDEDLLRERNRLEKCDFIPAGDSLRGFIKQQLKNLTKQKKQLQSQIDALIAAHADLRRIQRRLLSIKGIGPLTSQSLLPFLYRDQFESARQLAAYLGLTPVHKRSGTSLNKRGRLSGRGNRHMRAKLYMPAVSARTHNPAMATFYDTLIRRGRTPKQALTAIMRKLVHACYGVVKNDQNYQCPMST